VLLILQRYIKIATKCNSADEHRLEEVEVEKPSPRSRRSSLSPDTKVAALLTHPRYLDLGASRQKEWHGTMRTTRLPGSRGSGSDSGNLGCGGHNPDSTGRKAGSPQPLMAGPTCLLVPASSTLAAWPADLFANPGAGPASHSPERRSAQRTAHAVRRRTSSIGSTASRPQTTRVRASAR
jgi:hypothetical protein